MSRPFLLDGKLLSSKSLCAFAHSLFGTQASSVREKELFYQIVRII